MKYAGLDIHTKNIVYTVLSEYGSVVMQGKIENDANEIDKFLNNFEKNDQFVMESHDPKNLFMIKLNQKDLQ